MASQLDGLSTTEVKLRLAQYGYNELPEAQRRPLLLWTTILTKVFATLAAVYGWFMVPIGWQWAGLIWAYALAWFLVNDRVKLAGYRIVDPQQSVLASQGCRGRPFAGKL